eukprot:144424-Pelagomonas_calceolata.AAC.6
MRARKCKQPRQHCFAVTNLLLPLEHGAPSFAAAVAPFLFELPGAAPGSLIGHAPILFEQLLIAPSAQMPCVPDTCTESAENLY